MSFVYNGANQIACRDDGNGVCGDAGDIAYSYDAYGNLTGDGIKSYTYDAENRLVSVTDGVSVTSYTYNGDGERMAQTLDGVTTSYVLDTAAPLTMVLAETSGTETIYYLHGLDLVAQSDGETVEFFGYDGLGSVRQLLDGAGNVLFAQVFDPYGNEYASVGEYALYIYVCILTQATDSPESRRIAMGWCTCGPGITTRAKAGSCSGIRGVGFFNRRAQ